MNKNLLLKARVGTDSAGASLALRSWSEPSLMVIGSLLWKPLGGTGGPAALRWGVHLQVCACGGGTLQTAPVAGPQLLLNLRAHQRVRWIYG